MMHDLTLVLPMAIVASGAVLLMLLSVLQPLRLQTYSLITVAILTIALVIEWPHFGMGSVEYAFAGAFGTMFVIDDFATLFDLMFLLGAIFTLLINLVYLKKRDYYNGEFFALMLFSIFGMMMLAHAKELMSAFVALELASLSIYALVGYHKNKSFSTEAMFKYIVLGSMTALFFILGVALIYGTVGSTYIGDVAGYIDSHTGRALLPVIVGGSMIMVTILFKIGAVPFHAWVMDVYEGAPFPVTMFMASTFKIALFAVALRIYLVDFIDASHYWTTMLQIIALLTLAVGSWLAISQKKLKRMLSASSIVHSGYMLIALSSIGLGAAYAAPSIMFYLITYFLSAVGAFGILSYVASDAKRPLTYEDFKGFAQRRPFLAAAMTVFMLSLSGFPSTIGFLGKFYIFTGAIEAGEILLAGFGILIAFISVYYYFKLIAMMYFYPSIEGRKEFEFSVSTLLIGIMAVTVVWGGLGTSLIPFMPGADGFIEIAHQAIGSLFG